MAEETQEYQDWREEYLYLRRQIFSYDEDYDVFSDLRMNMKDLKYASILRKAKIQRDEDAFNCDLEKNEMLQQLKLMRKEISTLTSKMSTRNPKLKGFYRQEAEKMLVKQEEFKDYHGKNFEFVEQEKQTLEEFLSNFDYEMKDKSINKNQKSMKASKEMEEAQKGLVLESNAHLSRVSEQPDDESRIAQARMLSSMNSTKVLELEEQRDVILELQNENGSKQYKQKMTKLRKDDDDNEEVEDEDSNTMMLTSPRKVELKGEMNKIKAEIDKIKKEEYQQNDVSRTYSSKKNDYKQSEIPSSNESFLQNRSYIQSPQKSVYEKSIESIGNSIEDEKDMNQLRDCIKKLDSMLLQNGGRNCGWSEEDHGQFVLLYKKYGGRQGLLRSRSAKSEDSLAVLQFHSQENILQHIQLYEQFLSIQQQKQKFIEEYRHLGRKGEKRKREELDIIRQLREQREIMVIRERIRKSIQKTDVQAQKLKDAKKMYQDIETKSTRGYQERLIKREQEVFENLKRHQSERQLLIEKQVKKNKDVKHRVIPQMKDSDEGQEGNHKQSKLSEIEQNIEMRLQQLEQLKAEKFQKQQKGQKYLTPQVQRKQIATPLSQLLKY